jgi:molybdopterin synthase catalytic subunit
MTRSGIVTSPIDVGAIIDEVRNVEAGAIATFLGTVRDSSNSRKVTGLEYSAYAGMATHEMDAIVREATAIAPGVHIVAVHRVGDLAVGDVCVLIGAAHAHRGPAFDACRYVIEEIKKRVPIWKRERYADGSTEWVNAHASHGDAGAHSQDAHT